MGNVIVGADNPDNPSFLFYELNRRCNLGCLHCDFWKQHDSDKARYLSRSQRETLFSEFADLGGKVLVTCGGEPLLDPAEYYHMADCARKNGLKLFSVTNGSCIGTLDKAVNAVRYGAHEITVSFDDYIESEHDRHRGARGSFRAACRAVQLLVRARDEYKTDTKIFIMTIVREGLYRRLPEFFEFAKQLGADRLKLNVLQPSFGVPRDDEYYAAEYVRDPDTLERVLRNCDRTYGLGLSSDWITQVRDYFRAITATDLIQIRQGWSGGTQTFTAICNSYDRNIMVSAYGSLGLCFSAEFPHGMFQGAGDLTRFWRIERETLKPLMEGCKKPCGISHSVRAIAARRKQLAEEQDAIDTPPVIPFVTPKLPDES